ncbi:MAG: hypothetical protein RL238_2346 [Actinomycetota bacterium]
MNESLVLFRRAVLDRRRWFFGWSIGIVALVVITLAFWPSFNDQADEMNDMMDKLPESVKSLIGMGGGLDPFSPVGYLSSQIYAFMLPLLLAIAGISVGASLAGDEEHGLLETVYVLPVSRRRVVLERWLAMVVLTAALAAVTFVAVLATVRVVDMPIGTAAMALASATGAVLTWSLSGIAVLVGAWTGRRGVAITVAVVVGVASYVITGLADAGIGAFEALEPFSLFTHYDVVHTLVQGRPSWSVLVLVAVTAASLGAALWGIDRRDLRAG